MLIHADTHLQFQPGSSFFIQHFFILEFILIVLRIEGSKKEDSKEIYRNIALKSPELAVEQLYVVDHIVYLVCNGLLQSWRSTCYFEYHIYVVLFHTFKGQILKDRTLKWILSYLSSHFLDFIAWFWLIIRNSEKKQLDKKLLIEGWYQQRCGSDLGSTERKLGSLTK